MVGNPEDRFSQNEAHMCLIPLVVNGLLSVLNFDTSFFPLTIDHRFSFQVVYHAKANSVDTDQAAQGAVRSGSTLFGICLHLVDLCHHVQINEP